LWKKGQTQNKIDPRETKQRIRDHLKVMGKTGKQYRLGFSIDEKRELGKNFTSRTKKKKKKPTEHTIDSNGLVRSLNEKKSPP